jgi:hypothetical protein
MDWNLGEQASDQIPNLRETESLKGASKAGYEIRARRAPPVMSIGGHEGYQQSVQEAVTHLNAA